MHNVIIILRPNGRWCLQVDGERSPENIYEHPIIFMGFMGLTDYYEGQAGVYEVTYQPDQGVVRDETV